MKVAALLITCNGDTYLDKWFEKNVNLFDYICVSEGATVNWMKALQWNKCRSHDKTNNIIDLWKYKYPYKIFVHRSDKPYPEKCEQQNEALKLVPDDTDYIWILDSDEFYHDAFVKSMRERFDDEYCNYKVFMWHFFKQYNVVGVGGNGWGYSMPVDRIFKYAPGARFSNHRPITLHLGGRPITENSIDLPLCCHHYSYVEEKDVYQKMLYYSRTFGRDYMTNWYYPVWKKWTLETRDEIEKQYSIHPSVSGACTEIVELIHPIEL